MRRKLVAEEDVFAQKFSVRRGRPDREDVRLGYVVGVRVDCHAVAVHLVLSGKSSARHVHPQGSLGHHAGVVAEDALDPELEPMPTDRDHAVVERSHFLPALGCIVPVGRTPEVVDSLLPERVHECVHITCDLSGHVVGHERQEPSLVRVGLAVEVAQHTLGRTFGHNRFDLVLGWSRGGGHAGDTTAGKEAWSGHRNWRRRGPGGVQTGAMLIRAHDDASNDDERWRTFVQDQGFGHLVAGGSARQVPVVVPTQFVLTGDTILLHLARANPVFARLGEDDRCVMSVAGDWAYIPGTRKAIGDEDPRRGIPTTYYGAVQLTGTATVADAADQIAETLIDQLADLEPDADYVDPREHGRKLTAIRALRIDVTEVRAKFKYGGNVDDAHRSHVAAQLKRRGGPGDAAALGWLRTDS